MRTSRTTSQGLPVDFEAVDGDRELPQVRDNQPTGEVSTAPPMPEETAGSESVQPDEEDETTDPHHELHQAAKMQVLEFLDRLQDGTVMVGDRELTYCVACGDPRHTLQECQFDPTSVSQINRSLQQMRQAIHRYPRHQPVGPAREGATDVPMRSAEDGVPMEAETGSAASSTTRILHVESTSNKLDLSVRMQWVN